MQSSFKFSVLQYSLPGVVSVSSPLDRQLTCLEHSDSPVCWFGLAIIFSSGPNFGVSSGKVLCATKDDSTGMNK